MQGGALVGVVLFQIPIRSRKSNLSNRSMGLKAYQTTKHWTAVYNTMRQDLTTLENNYEDSHLSFITMIAT